MLLFVVKTVEDFKELFCIDYHFFFLFFFALLVRCVS